MGTSERVFAPHQALLCGLAGLGGVGGLSLLSASCQLPPSMSSSSPPSPYSADGGSARLVYVVEDDLGAAARQEVRILLA